MSPEEIAWSVIEQNIYNVPTNGQLKRLIAAAIREAVADEREAILAIHVGHYNVLEHAQDNLSPMNMSLMREIALTTAFIDAIRARSEKVSPDVVKGDEVTSTE